MHRWTLGSLRALPVVGLLAVGLAVSPAVPVAAQSSGTWTKTGSMTTPRNGQSATVLPNGQVLVVCGTGAETYDPASGTWANDGNAAPPASRFWSTALLPTGKVLLSGGVNGSYPAKVTETASAVLFDPVTGTTTVTGSMTIPREGHTLTPLPNGQVLAAGGQTENKLGKFSETASAELYTP